ncbi:hypothetical protein JCM3770_002812 [Rhodotorula araucariae]
MARRAVLSLVWAAALARAALVLSDGKLAVVDTALASAVASSSFTSDRPQPLAPRALQETDSLKLSFAVTRDSLPLVPQQAHVLAQPANPSLRAPGRDWLSPAKVRPSSGKGRWDLDLAHAPPLLLSLASFAPLEFSLVVGHPNETALALPLGTFSLPAQLALPFPFPPDAALPPHWEADRYAPRPEIHWTFRPGESRVRAPLALAGLVLVLAPWLVLGLALTPVVPSLRPSPPRTRSLVILVVLLTGLEALFAAYWARLRLLPTLPAFAALAALAAFVARGALGELRSRRTAIESRHGGDDERTLARAKTE